MKSFFTTHRSFLTSISSYLPLAVLAAYWLLLIRQLGAHWSLYQQYNYGWSVPFLCGYLIWSRWQQSKGSVQTSAARLGIACLAALALLYAPTRLVHEANPVWRLTALLWTLEVLGLTLLVVRFALGAERLKQLAFPICFFLVAVPWPYPLEVFMVDTLTRVNVGTTIELLGWFGVPAVQHGNVIEIGAGMVGIDEACSGIRSFQATLMISLFLGELYGFGLVRRQFCICAGLVFAFAFNVARTLLLTRVASLKGTAAIAAWHDPAGITILVACFVSLWLLALWLRNGSQPMGESRAANHNNVSDKVTDNNSSKGPDAKCITQYASVALGVWLILVEAGTQSWYRAHERATTHQENWDIQMFPGHKTKDVQKLVTAEFKYDRAIAAEWEDANGAQWQLYYFRWDPARSLDRRVRVQRAKMHGPATCLTHIGMTLKENLGTRLISAGNFNLAIEHYLFDVEGRLLHVFFGIYDDQTGNAVLANRRLGTIPRIKAALQGSRNYGQRFLEAGVSGYASPQEAEAAFAREFRKLIRVSKSDS